MNTYLLNIFSIRLIEEEINKITQSKTNIIKINFDDSNIENVIDECSYFSLLNEEKIVIVNNFKLPSDNSLFERYLENPNLDTTLILIVSSLDKRNRFYKKIKDKGTVIDIQSLTPNELNSKVQSYAKRNNISLDYLALNKLKEYNLDNYDLILSDIDKISIINNNITINEVNDYCTQILGDDSFALSDAIVSKKKDESISLLDDFIQNKKEVVPFVSLLASSFRLILIVKDCNLGNEALAKELGIHPYRVKIAKDKSYLYSREEIENIILRLVDLDYDLKSLNVSPYSLLKAFIIEL